RHNVIGLQSFIASSISCLPPDVTMHGEYDRKVSKASSTSHFYVSTTGCLHKFFVEEPASNWCLEAFMNRFIDEETDLDFKQSKEFFLSNLTQIKNQKNIDNPIRLFCSNYIGWIETWKGQAVSNACCEFFQESKRLKTHLRQKHKHNEIAEECIFENAKYVAFNNTISQRTQRKTQTPPPQSPQSLMPIMPNKRIVKHEEVK
ncbi:17274_t:CDS:2, partial [Dentiscutata erythropus]